MFVANKSLKSIKSTLNLWGVKVSEETFNKMTPNEINKLYRKAWKMHKATNEVENFIDYFDKPKEKNSQKNS